MSLSSLLELDLTAIKVVKGVSSKITLSI